MDSSVGVAARVAHPHVFFFFGESGAELHREEEHLGHGLHRRLTGPINGAVGVAIGIESSMADSCGESRASLSIVAARAFNARFASGGNSSCETSSAPSSPLLSSVDVNKQISAASSER